MEERSNIMKKEIYTYQKQQNGFRIKYELLDPNIDVFEEQFRDLRSELEDLEEYSKQLKNSADGLDYALAVTSGIIAGIIDSVIVGKWDFKKAKANSNKEINIYIQEFAKKNGLEDDSNRLEKAVKFLEDKFPQPGDAPWLHEGIDSYGNTVLEKHISSTSHHLDDLSHHPTIVGLISCILAQFTLKSTYYNASGQKIIIPIDVDENGMLEGKTCSAKVASGFINWCFQVAKNRHGHLISDLGGSKKTAGRGMGLPGSITSLLKELSCLPGIRETDFPQKVSAAYQKGIGMNPGQVDLGLFNCLFDGAKSTLDVRTENAIAHELKRQSIPLIINEVMVRSCYFLRHLILEWKATGDLLKVNLKKIMPYNNRTIVRMITVSTGVFELIDLSDATIRAALKSKGTEVEFTRQLVLRGNFIGIGRFALSCGAELLMESRDGRMELALATGEVALASGELVQVIDAVETVNCRVNTEIEELIRTNDEVSQFQF